ncbi:HEXXH motif-containing putative peptide modification protein [Collimonas sp. H4R21]|uniref:HEXXH motif-containing putative peptide modification protein n=1 Tax=Collimonas rhizosphaerae TaxID=3126357 RepID=A0ABU9PZA1_9BURK
MHTSETLINVSAFPSTNNAQVLYLNYQRRVFNSLLHVAKAAAGPLNIDISGIKRLSDRFVNTPASSYLFATNCLCVESIKKCNGIDGLKSALINFNETAEDDLIFVFPIIRNISDVQWVKGEDVADVANKAFEKNRNFYTLTANIKPVMEESFIFHKNFINKALVLLKNSPAHVYFDELCRYISTIGLYDGIGISGWSSEQHIGAIFIRNSTGSGELREGVEATVVNAPPLVYYVEQLIHETAHVHLDLLMETHKLFLNDNEAKYVSPIRFDLRPMRGVFHAVFVLTRIYNVLRSINFSEERDENYRLARCKVIEGKVKSGLKEIHKNAVLTESGRFLLEDMAKLLRFP